VNAQHRDAEGIDLILVDLDEVVPPGSTSPNPVTLTCVCGSRNDFL